MPAIDRSLSDCRYDASADEHFQESIAVQSSLGASTQEEVCAELALGGDGAKNDEFVFKNEEMCIKNEEFCIKNDECCR